MMRNKSKLFLCALIFCVGLVFVFLKQTENEGKRAILSIKRLLSESEFGIKYLKDWKKRVFPSPQKKEKEYILCHLGI